MFKPEAVPKTVYLDAHNTPLSNIYINCQNRQKQTEGLTANVFFWRLTFRTSPQ